MRRLTLVEVYAEMPYTRKRIHLHEILVLIFQLLPQVFQLLSSELPITPLSRFPVIGSHARRRSPGSWGGVFLLCAFSPNWTADLVFNCQRIRAKEKWAAILGIESNSALGGSSNKMGRLCEADTDPCFTAPAAAKRSGLLFPRFHDFDASSSANPPEHSAGSRYAHCVASMITKLFVVLRVSSPSTMSNQWDPDRTAKVLEMEFPESQNSRDARIEHLWRKLDPQNKGELDFNGLKKGLTKIDHRK
jgi:hypothetical protein